MMKEIELDLGYNPPASWLEEITGIKLTDYFATDNPKDPDYEYFYEFDDDAVSKW